MMFSTVILAGGLATRLRPVTITIPKALIEVQGRPFIFWQLEYLFKQGIRKVVLCVGYLGEMIQDLVGDGSQFGIEVIYSFDGDELLKTGGALKKALPYLEDNFFVLYGDTFLPVDFKEIQQEFASYRKPALMTIFKNANNFDKSNVFFVDGELKEYNKSNPTSEMNYIDYGLAIVNKKVFADFSSETVFDLADLYYKLSIQGLLAGYEVFERFYEVGSFSGIEDTESYFGTLERA
ncbi:MAG: nucleotidyltransferase family protein [Legionellaceae bacterium]|nr:nucleotidyltransferase family protein [Legionellaceae bacterium]